MYALLFMPVPALLGMAMLPSASRSDRYKINVTLCILLMIAGPLVVMGLLIALSGK